jgi:FlaA1/EpsC-like NDP-sugar epimerase
MKRILITGGTGTLGHALTKELLKRKDLERLIIFSRDELKQERMSEHFQDQRLRFVLGDVRNKKSIIRALDRVDAIIHAAALKRVANGDLFPHEYFKTNVEGVRNVLEACEESFIERALLVSTDKAVEPVNTYGATKLFGERLWKLQAKQGGAFAIVRYGNVLASNGSVLQKWKEKIKKNENHYIAQNCSRFWITQSAAARFCLKALELATGGEVFVKPSIALTNEELYKIFCGDTGLAWLSTKNPGEKNHESLVGINEEPNVFSIQDFFVLLEDGQKEKLDYWRLKSAIFNENESTVKNLPISSKYFLLNDDEKKQKVKELIDAVA